jgi:exopolyphosphatase/guanosine-5'-triphosphate,3'-diphosphate pyrophosphatase
MVKAAIGIGSNAVRMLAADCIDGNFIPVNRFREDVRPFAGLSGGKFSLEIIERIADTVDAFHSIAINDYCASEVALVATSACRDASNSDDLADIIHNKCGLTLQILTGEQEARYSFIGASHSVQANAMIDIGGGSTEIAAEIDGDIRSVSMQLGAVRLLHSGTTIDELIESMRSNVGFISAGMRIAGVGGTITTLAKMRGNPLSISAVGDALAELEGKTIEERYNIKGLPKKRADVIVPGCRILLAFMRAFGIDAVHATDSGNLDGVIISNYCK